MIFRVARALGIAPVEMVMEKKTEQFVAKLFRRTKETTPGVAEHAIDSIVAITNLNTTHPLAKALQVVTTEPPAARSWRVKKDRMHAELRRTQTEDRRRKKPKKGKTRVSREPEYNPLDDEEDNLMRGLVDPRWSAEMRKALLRWLIYRFPVEYKPTEQEEDQLEVIPGMNRLTEQEFSKLTELMERLVEKETTAWKQKNNR